MYGLIEDEEQKAEKFTLRIKFEEPKLSDFNVIVTRDRNLDINTYYFMRKFRTLDVRNYNNSAFGGHITSLELAEQCDHVVSHFNDKTFKVLKCRGGGRSGAVALRLVADYLESI
jgi:hypothetical protein